MGELDTGDPDVEALDLIMMLSVTDRVCTGSVDSYSSSDSAPLPLPLPFPLPMSCVYAGASISSSSTLVVVEEIG